MTLKEIQQLSDDQLRIEVAKRRGYTYASEDKDGDGDFYDQLRAPGGRLITMQRGTGFPWPVDSLPKYTADLNAIHEVEMFHFHLLVENQHWLQLNDVLPSNERFQYGHWHMSPRQRCEALVLTLDKAAEKQTHETQR